MPPPWRKVRRAFERMGCTLRPGKGSHIIVQNPATGAIYPIGVHGDGAEISEIYIRRACAALSLDEAALRRLL